MARGTSLARDALIEDLDRKAMAMSWLKERPEGCRSVELWFCPPSATGGQNSRDDPGCFLPFSASLDC